MSLDRLVCEVELFLKLKMSLLAPLGWPREKLELAYNIHKDRLALKPHPWQDETLRAMFFSSTLTKESFSTFWPRGKGMTTLISMFLGILTSVGLAPPRITILKHTDLQGVETAYSLEKFIPGLLHDDLYQEGGRYVHFGKVALVYQTEPRQKLELLLSRALSKASMDIVKLVASYSDYGICRIEMRSQLCSDPISPRPDLLIADGLFCMMRQLPVLRAQGTLMFLFVNDRHVDTETVTLPILSICATPEWEQTEDRVAAEYVEFAPAGYIDDGGELQHGLEARQSIQMDLYHTSHELRRRALKCSTM